MAEWPGGIRAITLFVEDYDTTKEFYRRVFEHDPAFEDDDSAVFKLDNTLVNVLRVSEAAELVTPTPVGSPDVGSRLMFTIEVDDVDARCAWLAEVGVPLLNGPVDRSWGVRTAAFSDPAGNVWELAQPIKQPPG